MAAPPELQQLLAMSRDRTAYQNPLFQAVTQMAYGGLPTYARQGTQLSGTLSNQAPPAQASGGMNPLAAAALGGAGGALLRSLANGSGGDLGKLLAGLKKLFSHGGQGIQGNQPYGGGGLTGGGQPSQYPFSGFAGNEGMDPNQWPGGGLTPNVTTSEDFGLYGAGGAGDVGPYWPDSGYGGGGMGDQGPIDDTYHP